MENQKGKLTIFLGAAPGSGKTYALLEAGLSRLSEGTDVIIGLLENDNAKEIKNFSDNIPKIKPIKIFYRGRAYNEPDIDSIMKRAPQLVLIDNLAHSINPASKNKKLYQDIEGLLNQGIDVYTTLNIQNIESLKDIVSQITGINVKHTIPDKFIDNAYQIKLIDTPPEELIERFNQGKILIPSEQKQDAIKFFRMGNISALRELALRYTAQRVDKQLDEYMKTNSIKGPWQASEKIMACVSPSPFSAQVIRTARRIASGLKTQWIAAYVEAPNNSPKNDHEKEQLAKNLRLAAELGAEIINLSGDDVSEELINLAENKNVTQIVIGKPLQSKLKDFWKPSIVDKIVKNSQNISIHVIPSKKKQESSKRNFEYLTSTKYFPYISTALLVILTTIVNKFIGFDLINIALLYLLPVLFSASLWGKGPSIFASLLGVLSFDIFFVPPFFSITVHDLKYLISFTIFLVVAVITGTLATRLRNQAVISRKREIRTAALYELSRKIAVETDIEGILNIVVNVVSETIDGDAVIFMPNENDKMIVKATTILPTHRLLNTGEMDAVIFVYNHGQNAGSGTETLSEAYGFYLPLKSDNKTVGVLGVHSKNPEHFLSSDQRRLLEAFTDLTALAIVRLQLATEAHKSRYLVQSEKLRTALFNSISHELRTPLSSIMGAVTSLLEEGGLYSEEDQKALLQTVNDGASRMNRLVGNLLDMARLESGMMQLKRELCDIEDIIGVAIRRVQDFLNTRKLKIIIPSNLSMVEADFALIEQVIVNLLDNAIKYSSENDEILISVSQEEKNIKVSIEDNGPGIKILDMEKIFDKFYRLDSPHHVTGTGLGLSICKGIIEAHDGEIFVESKKGNGSIFTFTLPLEKQTMLNKISEIREGDTYE